MGKKKSKAKEQYRELIKTGMLWEFHPELAGNWWTDKEVFKKIVRKKNK